MDKLKDLVKSRKFWAAVVGLGLIIVKAFRPDFPLAEDQLTQIVWVLVAFILGTGLEDSRLLRSRNSRSLRPPLVLRLLFVGVRVNEVLYA